MSARLASHSPARRAKYPALAHNVPAINRARLNLLQYPTCQNRGGSKALPNLPWQRMVYSYCCALALGSYYPRRTSSSHAPADLWRARRHCLLAFLVYSSLQIEVSSAAGNVRAVGFPSSARRVKYQRLRTTFMYKPLRV